MQLPATLSDRIGPAPVVVFDGECVLCAHSFRFLLKHDRERRLRFVTAQSPLGQEIYAALGLSTESYETTLVLVAGECHAKTRAVAAALRVIGGGWRWLSCIGWLPRWLADPVYSLVARNRYRWFGRHDSCMIPDADVRARFLPGGWG
ncbi:thiol-disulfide oxidoreductase DCC family protein [Nioella sp.]|uniref:thiol-disulfide oxidoreductase DCC family protein n=1 Tax=Nioella sp. TaxID=1912091 RepID=UPI003A8B5961